MKSLRQRLLEEKIVKYENETTPRFGWCTALVGGGGSGKNYVARTNILQDFKMIDIDEFKKKYLKLKRSDIGGDTLDEKIERVMQDKVLVSKLHEIVSRKDWTRKQRDNMLRSAAKDRLPNIVFNLTGRYRENYDEIIALMKPLGYKFKIIWVVTDLDVALLRNSRRPRKEPEEIIKQAHKQVYDTFNEKIFNRPEYSKHIDSIDLVFNSGSNPDGTLTDEEKRYCLVHCEKTEHGFAIPAENLDKFLKLTFAASNVEL